MKNILNILSLFLVLIFLSSCGAGFDQTTIEDNFIKGNTELVEEEIPDSIETTGVESFEEEISSSWSCLDTDNFDLDGNGDRFDDCDEAFTVENGKLIAKARGRDIWRNTHQFQALYLEAQSGDFNYSLKIESMDTSPHTWSKLGLFVANDVSDFGMGGYVLCAQTNNQRVTVQWSGNDSGDINGNRVDGTSDKPIWLRIEKIGNDVNCYFKYNLEDSWTHHSAGSITRNFAGVFDVGIILTSHNSNSTLQVTYDDFIDLNKN